MNTIYLLECDGFYKIGVAKDVKRRIVDLQIGSPHKINLIAKSLVKDGSAYEAENYLHIILKTLNISGEWFRLSDEIIELLLETYKFLETANFDNFPYLRQKWVEVSSELNDVLSQLDKYSLSSTQP